MKRSSPTTLATRLPNPEETPTMFDSSIVEYRRTNRALRQARTPAPFVRVARRAIAPLDPGTWLLVCAGGLILGLLIR